MEINMLINMVTEEIYLINIFVGSNPTSPVSSFLGKRVIKMASLVAQW